MSFDPESYRTIEKLVMDRKRRLGVPDWMTKILSAVIAPGTTMIAPGALPPLAGDVTGAPGANTAVKLQGIPVSTTDPATDQVLKFDGSAWAPGMDNAGTLTVQEIDGAPLDAAVTIIRVTNGKLTDNGAGDVTLDLSGTALTVQEVDGSPTETPTATLQFPDGTLTEPGAGIVRYTPAAAPSAPIDATYIVRTANATLTNEVLLNAVLASELQTRYEPLTNGDPVTPELVFAGGDVIMAEVLV